MHAIRRGGVWVQIIRERERGGKQNKARGVWMSGYPLWLFESFSWNPLEKQPCQAFSTNRKRSLHPNSRLLRSLPHSPCWSTLVYSPLVLFSFSRHWWKWWCHSWASVHRRFNLITQIYLLEFQWESTCFVSRGEFHSLLTTQSAWRIPGNQAKQQRTMFINNWTSHPLSKNTAKGGRKSALN